MHFYSQKNIQSLEQYLGVKSHPGVDEIHLLEKVSHYNSYFKYIPGILGIAVCNSLAMNSAHKDSDIDLFIITKKNRLWTARIFMTIFLTLLGQRKTSKNHTGKFCLSFFISEEGLSFEKIAIENDIYLSYWVDTMIPIINRNNIFREFRKQNSLLNSLPLQGKEATDGKDIEEVLLKTRRLLKIFGDIIEKLLQSIFLPRTKKSFQKLGKPFGIVISDTMLKFHDNDKRIEIRDAIISS